MTPQTQRRIPVIVVLPPRTLLLDIAGPLEVLRRANLIQRAVQFDVTYTGATPAQRSSIGLEIAGLAPLPERVPRDAIVIVSGNVDELIDGSGEAPGDAAADQRIVDWLVRTIRPGIRLVTICSGALLAARAGLLDGYNCTTHHASCAQLAALAPQAKIIENRNYVEDRERLSSAGVTAGIDLALALVEDDHGPDLARDVARALVVYMQRAGGQSQFSAPLQGPPPRSPALRTVTDLVTANPRGDYSLDELAKHLNVSTRHLTRLFHDELSTTPARYVESIRFDLARALLDQGHTATQAAASAGFPSYESMRRVFARKLGISPAAYQRRFSTAQRASAPGD